MGRFDHVVGVDACSTLPAEFPSISLGATHAEIAGGSGLHHDPADGWSGSWENAWIDLGGEG